ncbi:GNAT family N-acetyltransferase [Lederbergia wuyishanensis]|uniref:N-acetylglutamate synthase-like GNAT family acetyltransferase n=1 Tax=Lederbergia wuyishanensis TaxID=1347903 RepID=A0ABU0D703_9BACI|nr:GNAT family N-acetyltransferase [Lederbergia wuyishanensis]MCJ8008848.1 GNAT family N-acetyltransferase [Lederbergia wuyishanensis]MDQ0344170.1 N-acetylglutamate synthase-like GNAT family acetyltransferase [Lederbergia wuyishanensis]
MHFRKIQKRDLVELNQLFKSCLTDLVIREKKEFKLIDDEVDRLNYIVQDSFLNSELHFYVTEMDNHIVGSIALTKPNPFITENISTIQTGYEVACVYIHPSFQRQGIGKFMFKQIKKELARLGQVKYYLDAGFQSSQQYWRQVLGEPSLILEDYWGKGEHHLIWVRELV